MKRDLNDAWLRGLKPPEAGRLEIWDTRVVGLVLRLTPSGAASWSVRARTRAGKRTRLGLGALMSAVKAFWRATSPASDGGSIEAA